MTIFFKDKIPFIEGVSVNDLISSHQTPFYVYSQNKIASTFTNFKNAINSEIFYAVKANSNQAILSLMKSLGAGADVVSIGELKRALIAGFEPSNIILEGVGKTKSDIEFASKQNIRQINVESKEELSMIDSIGKSLDRVIDCGIRINPDIDSQSLDKISTGKKTDKFGIEINQIKELCEIIKSSKNIKLKGISCHIGSQIFNLDIFKKIYLKMKDISSIFKSQNIEIQHLDLGGGFGVNYNNEEELNIKEIGKIIKSIFSDQKYSLSFEPGRYLIAKAGVLITKIITSKKNGGVEFLICDAGMHTFLRPALYKAKHDIKCLNNINSSEKKYTIAGPICESSDIIAKNLFLPEQQTGNYLAIMDTGAYGFVMASNYNSRSLPSELLINENHYEIIRKEESLSEIIKRDIVPNWL